MKNTINIIPSKSMAHRALICNALGLSQTNVIFSQTSEDIEATEACLEGLREYDGKGTCVLPCNESGSTLRFLLPVVGALGIKGQFLPKGRLPERPLSPLYEELLSHGMEMSPQGEVPFRVWGQLLPGTFSLPGNVSSQYISGLLFALPLLHGDSRIKITTPLESKSYVDMTLDMLKRFGIEVKTEDFGFFVKGNQRYKGPQNLFVEGDWSNGAFWLCAGALLEDGITCENLNLKSLQGDKAVVDILREFGADVSLGENSVTVKKSKLRGITVDAKDVPDLIPAISVVAAVAQGRTVIKNAERLRIKESDRLKAVAETLNGLGGNVSETKDGLVIIGKDGLSGGEADSFGDHRIAMMSAIASLVTFEEVRLKGWKAVNKSYPGFFQDLMVLGDRVKVVKE